MPLGAFKAALMGTAGVSAEADVVLLSTQTASNSATISFTSDITSTYGEYIFKFYDIGPATNDVHFLFQVNGAGESGYNETIDSTQFSAGHAEADNWNNLFYVTSGDQIQGTAFQYLSSGSGGIGNGADESVAGELHLYNPAGPTYPKHFHAFISEYEKDNQLFTSYTGGYIDTSTAIDEIQFKMESGNFDGKIKMWGVK